MDLAEGLDMDFALSLPSPVISSPPPLSGFGSPLCMFFPPSESQMLHLSSSEGMDVVGINGKETEDSPLQSLVYEVF